MKKIIAIIQFVIVVFNLILLEDGSFISRVIYPDLRYVLILIFSTIIFWICAKFLQSRGMSNKFSLIGWIIIFGLWVLYIANIIINPSTSRYLIDLLILACSILLFAGGIKLIKEKKWGTELSLIGWIMFVGLLFYFMINFQLNGFGMM